jgi:hypothetical protein
LERWNPDSLTICATAIRDGGRSIGAAVTALSTNIATMPETQTWAGDAHTAATTMFDRAAKQTDAFSAYTSAVSEALTAGARSIGVDRTALLHKADQIDTSGQLNVSEQWVVLITGASMTAEEAAALERRAQAKATFYSALRALKCGTAPGARSCAVGGTTSSRSRIAH